MSHVVVWALYLLGVAHLVFGVVRFKKPLARAVSSGFVNQFKERDAYAAFWFLMSGPPLMLAGHLAIHALALHDSYTLELIAIYTFVPAAIGVVAFPKSPLWAPLVLAPLVFAAGRGALP